MGTIPGQPKLTHYRLQVLRLPDPTVKTLEQEGNTKPSISPASLGAPHRVPYRFGRRGKSAIHGTPSYIPSFQMQVSVCVGVL